MKRSLGMKSFEVFEDCCCKCGNDFYGEDCNEKSATLDFNFGFYSIGLDGFYQNIELCEACAEELFFDFHKTLHPEAKRKYFDFKDEWWSRERKKLLGEGMLFISRDIEEIT